MPTPSKLTVDFSNVEDRREGGGKAAHVPEGDYLLQVVGVELMSKKDDPKSKYLKWRFKIVEPSRFTSKGTVYNNTTLKPEGLWALRNLLEDMGLKVEKKALDLPLAAIVKKQPIFGATLADGDEYNGKVKSEIVSTFKKEAYEGEKGGGEDTDSDEEESDSDDEEEEVDELDVDDL